MPVVSNSSPLIALAAIGRLDLAASLFHSVSIPPAVAAEIAPSIPNRPTWLQLRPLTGPLPSSVVRPALGHGEREAIALALELRPGHIVVDDLPARRLARALGLRVVGTLGILLVAKHRGLIDRVRPSLDDLVKNSFFVGPDLYEELLQLADESASS